MAVDEEPRREQRAHAETAPLCCVRRRVGVATREAAGNGQRARSQAFETLTCLGSHSHPPALLRALDACGRDAGPMVNHE